MTKPRQPGTGLTLRKAAKLLDLQDDLLAYERAYAAWEAIGEEPVTISFHMPRPPKGQNYNPEGGWKEGAHFHGHPIYGRALASTLIHLSENFIKNAIGRVQIWGRLDDDPDKPLTLIDDDLWRVRLLFDFDLNGFTFRPGYKGQGHVNGFLLYFLENEQSSNSDNDGTVSLKARNSGGRPPTYHWDLVLDAFMVKLAESGMPETQAECIKLVRECAVEGGQSEPDERTIRRIFKERFPRFFEKAKAQR